MSPPTEPAVVTLLTRVRFLKLAAVPEMALAVWKAMTSALELPNAWKPEMVARSPTLDELPTLSVEAAVAAARAICSVPAELPAPP